MNTASSSVKEDLPAPPGNNGKWRFGSGTPTKKGILILVVTIASRRVVPTRLGMWDTRSPIMVQLEKLPFKWRNLILENSPIFPLNHDFFGRKSSITNFLWVDFKLHLHMSLILVKPKHCNIRCSSSATRPCTRAKARRFSATKAWKWQVCRL